MIFRSAVISVGVLSVVAACAMAAETPQSQAEKMLERARELSDIRKSTAHAFRLKATFSFISENLDNFEGTYTELWASDSQWRREISVGNLRRVEVAAANQLWRFDGNQRLPEQANQVTGALLMFPSSLPKLEFESVSDIAAKGNSTRCAVSKPEGARKARHAFCFDQKNGLLVEKIAPELVRQRIAGYFCRYEKYIKFGEQWFPQEIACGVDGHRQLQVHVTDLTTDAFHDPTLFSPPTGSIDIGRCSSGALPPQPVSTPDPMFPIGERGHTAVVRVRLIVDVKGKPKNVEVSRSAGKAFDEMAVGTVRQWRFKPAICNGEPIPLQIEIEVNFRGLR